MTILLSFVVLILSIIVHEVAHGYAADSLGDPTARLAGRLTLNPVPHIDIMGSVLIPGILVLSGSSMLFGWAKPVPYNPYNLKNHRWGETVVAIAGSAANLFIAIVFGLIVQFGSTALSPAALYVAGTVALVNLFLGLFNLIPFPPLDGFTVLRTILPWNLASSLSRFEQQIHSIGPLFLILFLFLFVSVLAGPFYRLVTWIFGILTGIHI